MKISKTIKKQALFYLANDNWGIAIAGFLIILLPPVVIIMLFATIENALPFFLSKNVIEEIDKYTIYLIFPLILLTTPALTGYLKICYDISKGKNVQIRDIFYYFKNGLYRKTLYINMAITAKTVVAFIVVMIPALTLSAFYENTHNIIFYILALIFSFAGITAALFLGIRFIFIPCVYFEYESISYKELIAISTAYRKSNIKDLFEILISFLPQIFLCILVVPWIFVFPYISVAFMTNGKWINEIYKNNNLKKMPSAI